MNSCIGAAQKLTDLLIFYRMHTLKKRGGYRGGYLRFTWRMGVLKTNAETS